MHRGLGKTLSSVALAMGLANLAAISTSYAADPTDAIAQFRVGYLYERGDGVPQDYKQAMRLYLLSAAQGNAVAEFRIGYLYEKGWGVAADLPKRYSGMKRLLRKETRSPPAA